MAGFNGKGPPRSLDTWEGVFAAQWLQISGPLRSYYHCCTRTAPEKALGVVYKKMTTDLGVLLFVPVQKTRRGGVGGHYILFTLVGVAHKTEQALVIVSPSRLKMNDREPPIRRCTCGQSGGGVGRPYRARSRCQYDTPARFVPRRTGSSVELKTALRLKLSPLLLPRLSGLVRCQSILEITPIVVTKPSKIEVIRVRAAEARSTLLRTRLASPGRTARYSTRKYWRLA